MSLDERPDPYAPLRAPSQRSRASSRSGGYVLATLFVGLATAVALATESLFPVPDIEMLYLLVVMIAALYLGRGPSLLAAGLAVAAYDFFFVPPRFTFMVGDTRHILIFGMMFGAGLLVSSLAARLRRQEADAHFREERTRTLYTLTHELSSAKNEREIAVVASRLAWEVFAAEASVLTPDVRREPKLTAVYPLLNAMLDERDLDIARSVLEHGHPAGRGTDTLPAMASLAVPLAVGGAAPLAVLVLRPPPEGSLTAEQRTFLEGFCRQVALALSRTDLDERARQADLRARTEEMRSSLLSSVSHDLRTPLAAITGSATTLRENPALPPLAREQMLTTICEESERLERLVSNLLDMTRLESGAVKLNREWLPIDEVIGAALTRLEGPLGSRPVRVKVPADVPLVRVDPVLLEQLLVNLLENAAKHTPAGTDVEIIAGVADSTLSLEVADRGRGIPQGDEERVFERFYRRPEAGVPGVGLGLAICRAIARAHGGTLAASNRRDAAGGAAFRLAIPLEGSPPDAPTWDAAPPGALNGAQCR